MKIVFNLINCGLGNNGGSRTIVLSANTLTQLGYDVTLLSNIPCQYTWNKIIAKNKTIYKHHDTMSERIITESKYDVVIGTGIKTLKSTVNKYKNVKRKFHWIRGWETWQIEEKKMIDLFKKYQGKVIYLTNGIGIQKKLKKHGIDSILQFSGMDDCQEIVSYHNYLKNLKTKFSIGGLFHTKHKTKNSIWLINIYNYLKGLGYDVDLYGYGANMINVGSLDLDSNFHFTVNPNLKQKNKIYNKTDFWLSTSVSEGFHNPPAEYMIRGGIVIGVESELNGTKSYLFDNKTGFLCKPSWLDMAHKIEEVIQMDNKFLENISNNAYYFIRQTIGSRKYNMKKMIDILENA